MMKFVAEIEIMPHRELLDPQGKTVAANMGHLQITGVEDIRIGKHIRMVLEAADAAEASAKVEDACKRVLANVIMETFSFQLHPQEA